MRQKLIKKTKKWGFSLTHLAQKGKCYLFFLSWQKKAMHYTGFLSYCIFDPLFFGGEHLAAKFSILFGQLKKKNFKFKFSFAAFRFIMRDLFKHEHTSLTNCFSNSFIPINNYTSTWVHT